MGSFSHPSHTIVNFRSYAKMATTSLQSYKYPTLADKTLVSVEDCIEAYNLKPDGIAFVDGSWYHRSKRSGRADFEAGPRIANARYIDMDDIAAKGPELNPKNLPHMMPPPKLFAAAMDAMDIRSDQHVIVYGRDGCVFTPRTWFLFQQMGHESVSLMQGSLEDWISLGGDVETETAVALRVDALDLSQSATYRARDAQNVVGMSDMIEAVQRQGGEGSSDVILDPRGTSFDKHHMPGAVNIPYRSIVTEENLLKFRPKQELEALFEEKGIDVKTDERIMLTCGSGVSVCHLFVALAECGRDNKNTFVYDGSWAEWGSDERTPKMSIALESN